MGEEDAPSVDMAKVKRTHDRVKCVQREREVRLAVQLVERLQSIAGSDSSSQEALDEWEATICEEVRKLEQVTCGEEMLFLIGWIYANRARQYMAGGMMRRYLAKLEG